MKKYLFVTTVLLLTGTFSRSQSFLESITLSLNKGLEGLYEKGDTLKLYAEAPGNTAAVLEIYQNGKLKESREVLLTEGKSELFSNAYEESVALMFRLNNASDKSDSTLIGAIVAPEEFQPGLQEPDDFDAFWRKQLKAMRKVKMKPRLTPVEVPDEYKGKFVCYDLEINCAEGAPVRGYLALPSGSGRRSLPIAIYAHSAGNLKYKWTRSTVEKAIQLASYGNGAIGLDINAHGMRNGADEAYYTALQKELGTYSARPLVDHEHFYFRTMFLRMVRALDYLCGRKEWDRKKVLVTGGSQGGAQSAALAGLDKRVTHVVVDVPAMWDTGGKLLGRTSSWPKPLEREKDIPDAAKFMSYYDGSVMLRHFKGNLYVNVGLIDLTCPPASVWSSFNVCPAAHKEIHPCAWKGHSGKYSLPKASRREVRKAMNKGLEDAIAFGLHAEALTGQVVKVSGGNAL